MWCDWCDVMWCDVMWRDVTWRDVTWRDVTWCDVMWCDVCMYVWFDVPLDFSYFPPTLPFGFPLPIPFFPWRRSFQNWWPIRNWIFGWANWSLLPTFSSPRGFDPTLCGRCFKKITKVWNGFPLIAVVCLVTRLFHTLIFCLFSIQKVRIVFHLCCNAGVLSGTCFLERRASRSVDQNQKQVSLIVGAPVCYSEASGTKGKTFDVFRDSSILEKFIGFFFLQFPNSGKPTKTPHFQLWANKGC